MPTGLLSTATVRRRTVRHDRGPGRVQRVDRIAFDADLQSKVVHENGVTDYHGVATRGGVAFEYEEEGGVVREFRPIAEVMDPESLKGLHGALFSLDHPGDGVDDDHGLGEVTPANARDLFHGVVLSVEPDIQTGLVKVWIRVFTDRGLAAIEGGKVELSCGYTTELLDWRTEEGAVLVAAMELGTELGQAANGERYDYVQTAIVYNHISVVDQGRAGPVARLRNDKAHMNKLKLTYDGKTYEVSPFIAQAVKAQAVKKGDQLEGEVIGVEIEGMEPMRLTKGMVEQMLAAINVTKPAGPSIPEPEVAPIVDAEELEPNVDAEHLEEEEGKVGKMDADLARLVDKRVDDALARVLPEAAGKVAKAAAKVTRDRAALERTAAPFLGPEFDFGAYTPAGVAVQVLKADQSPKLAKAQTLALLADAGDMRAAGRLDEMMERVAEDRRDKQDSTGRLGAAMFRAADQATPDAEPEDEPPSWEKRNDALTKASQGKAEKAA